VIRRISCRILIVTEPTIAIVDAVAITPELNERYDIESGTNHYESSNNNNNNDNVESNFTKQPPQRNAPPPEQSNQAIVPLRRQQPPVRTIVYGHLGRYECHMQCPFCETMMITRTETRCDGMTWVFVLILFIVFWPLCWLPLCMPKCQRVYHYCSHCQRKVGITEPCS
jgi:lipopolysaccharide-induced tumor necrosis factor-alpha factor